MKENVLDVLLYLFENYLDDESETQTDRETLSVELEEAGFPRTEINKAFDWLETLSVDSGQADTPSQPQDAIRVYADRETERLGADCRGFLAYLESIGILAAAQRELVIDRIMALDSDDIGIDQVKWIILMVLFNQPGQEIAFARMEDLVLDDSLGLIH